MKDLYKKERNENEWARKSSDFRYNTGDTRVPWAAVGENYNAQDLMEIIQYLMQGNGVEYQAILDKIRENVYALDRVSTPPGKLSLGSQVENAEKEADAYLNTKGSVFVTNATAGFEIAYKYANLKAGDEVIVPAITFIATHGLSAVVWSPGRVCRPGSRVRSIWIQPMWQEKSHPVQR